MIGHTLREPKFGATAGTFAAGDDSRIRSLVSLKPYEPVDVSWTGSKTSAQKWAIYQAILAKIGTVYPIPFSLYDLRVDPRYGTPLWEIALVDRSWYSQILNWAGAPAPVDVSAFFGGTSSRLYLVLRKTGDFNFDGVCNAVDCGMADNAAATGGANAGTYNWRYLFRVASTQQTYVNAWDLAWVDVLSIHNLSAFRPAGQYETVMGGDPRLGSVVTLETGIAPVAVNQQSRDQTAVIYADDVIAALTISLPDDASSVTGQVIRIWSATAITAITITANQQDVLGDALTAAAASTLYIFQKIDAALWLRLQ